MRQLNETQLAQFKTQLNSSQEQIRLAINTIFQASDHASHHLAAQKLERLSTDELIEFTLKIDNPDLAKNINKLKKIDASLNCIEIGMYGLCSDCECDLVIEDLHSNPTIQRCPECAVKYQKQTYNNYRL